MIETLKPDGFGTYTDPDGCTWKTQFDYLCISVLGLCGCGKPGTYRDGKYLCELHALEAVLDNLRSEYDHYIFFTKAKIKCIEARIKELEP